MSAMCIYARSRVDDHAHHRFLSNFAKRTFTVSDQVKVINEFLVVRTPDKNLLLVDQTLIAIMLVHCCAYA